MFRNIRRPYLIMLLATIILAATMSVLKYTGMCRLKEVTIVPENYANHAKSLKTIMEQNLFAISIGEVTEKLLKKDNILHVDLDYSLPDGFNIEINKIEPVALVVANDGKKVYRLDMNNYLLPLDSTLDHFDFPIITGLKKCRVYKKIGDHRLKIIVDQLELIKNDFIDFYLALSNINISSENYISVYLDGLPFRIDTYAGALYQSIKNLKVFLLEYNPDLNGVKSVNMCSNKLIITKD